MRFCTLLDDRHGCTERYFLLSGDVCLVLSWWQRSELKLLTSAKKHMYLYMPQIACMAHLTTCSFPSTLSHHCGWTCSQVGDDAIGTNSCMLINPLREVELSPKTSPRKQPKKSPKDKITHRCIGTGLVRFCAQRLQHLTCIITWFLLRNNLRSPKRHQLQEYNTNPITHLNSAITGRPGAMTPNGMADAVDMHHRCNWKDSRVGLWPARQARQWIKNKTWTCPRPFSEKTLAVDRRTGGNLRFITYWNHGSINVLQSTGNRRHTAIICIRLYTCRSP